MGFSGIKYHDTSLCPNNAPFQDKDPYFSHVETFIVQYQVNATNKCNKSCLIPWQPKMPIIRKHCMPRPPSLLPNLGFSVIMSQTMHLFTQILAI